MTLRGRIVAVGDERTVGTDYGEQELVELRIEPSEPEDARRGPVTVTLWGKWTHTAEHAEPGMELLVTEPERDDYDGQPGYTTTKQSYVVLEPGFLVDVTDIRSWVQCPRMYYLNKLSGVPLAYPVVKGTIVHEVFGDLLRGRDLGDSIEERVGEAGLELGLLGYEREEVVDEVRRNAAAIEGWLAQGTLTEPDQWRSEYTLISPTFGVKGRADALRRGMPVELKTGKNTRSSPRFHDKIQAATYALVLEERGLEVDTGTLLYTKNTALDRTDTDGDLAPAKEFSVGKGLLEFVVRQRNEIAAAEWDYSVPTGYEADADCRTCFEQDTCMVVSGRLDQPSKAGQIGEAVPPEERDYFDRQYRAIEAERRAVHAEYRKLWEQPAAERAEDDRALIDLEPVGRRELSGGRWELLATKPGGTVSKLREGDVALASDGDPVGGHAELARIRTLRGDPEDADLDADDFDVDADDVHRDLVVVRADEPVELRRLDVYPSELSTDRMLTALHDAVLKGDPEQKDVLFGRRDPWFDVDRSGEGYVENNEAQDEAVRRAISAEDFALVHGPPGTGKTFTIARLVRALVARGDRVLLAAFTNRAVDNALEELRDHGVEGVVRVGTETGVREDMRDLRLDRAGDPNDRAAELRDADVVAATTATCGSRVLREESFDVAVVDEASQLTEPATLAATNLADRFVLVGDHHQLPPVVRSAGVADDDEAGPDTTADDDKAGPDTTTDDDAVVDGGGTDSGAGDGVVDADGDRGSTDARDVVSPAEAADLSRSLFERLRDAHPEASVLLDRQYRMAQAIQAFASREFYDGQLRPATPAVASQTLRDLPGVDVDRLPPELDGVVTFVDPGGEQVGNANPVEADRVAEIVDAYIDAGVDPDDVGVIAPFRAQVAEIQRRVDVTVDTVDRFQGSSEEVVVVSFVATGDLDGPIFEDTRRVNVALTRAKKSLTLVGDAAALSSEPVYGRMLEWARR